MWGFIVRQAALSAVTLLGVVTGVFFLIRLVPGDPAIAMLGPYATAEAIMDLRRSLGLDEPIWTQFRVYMFKLAAGDLGQSLSNRSPVAVEIAKVLPHTVVLALAGTALSIVTGIPAGVVSAVKRNSWLDHVARLLALAGVSIPIFFTGILLLLFFGLRLRWFPMLGAGNPEDWLSQLHHLVLPAVALGVGMAGTVMRMTRSSVLEILGQDYVRTARSKGLAEHVVIYKHALRNALVPVITVVGINMGQLMGGAVLTESVFGRPGLGKLMLDAILARDYPLVQGCILIFSAFVIIVHFLVDITYSLVDPRIRWQ